MASAIISMFFIGQVTLKYFLTKLTQMRIEQVKTQIVEYLEENGSASVSELVRAVGCGKSTIYEALSELESAGKVQSTMYRNRRMISLTYGIPKYVKALLAVTILCILSFIFFTSHPSQTMTVNLNGAKVVYVFIGPAIVPVIALSVITGFWMAIVVLKYEDLYGFVRIVRSFVQYLRRI